MQLQRLGPYKIVRQIGKGGMGAVYEGVCDRPGAEQGKRVAIKALSPQMAAAEGFRERFESEIVSMMQLSHEGIVQIYGKGEQDGVLFYSMELVEGTTLEEEINTGRRFNWRETLRVGIQVCRALKHAHDVGVVHRDIKPANLLLTAEGRVKIADFGIARFFHNTQLTTAGGVLGTADYMSPEQADGRQVTERCDQYSLGGVMFALLAGRPPFLAKTMPEMLQLQRFAEPEPVTRYAKDTPEQLNKLIDQLLAKEPNDRFPNVMVLGRHMEAMEKALSREESSRDGTTTKPAGKRKKNKERGATAELHDQKTRAMQYADPFNEETRSGPLPTDISEAATLAAPTDYASDNPTVDKSLGHEPIRSTFTTVDEEKRRQREQVSEHNWGLYAQFVLLVFTITLIVWLGWKIMRPYSADELYEVINSSVEEDGTENLRGLKSELDEFQERFPDDTRNEELNMYRQLLEFQRFERQARTRARVSGGDANSPVGQAYLHATQSANSSNGELLQKLQALVDLYDPSGLLKENGNSATTDNFTETDRLWLTLAYQKIRELREKSASTADSQLPALRERLKTAAALEQSDPFLAARIYNALVGLYGDQPWAQEVVEAARARIKRLAEEEP